MSDICDRADRSRDLKPGPISPNCTLCRPERHSHYPSQNHVTEDHSTWLQYMIALLG